MSCGRLPEVADLDAVAAEWIATDARRLPAVIPPPAKRQARRDQRRDRLVGYFGAAGGPGPYPGPHYDDLPGPGVPADLVGGRGGGGSSSWESYSTSKSDGARK